MNTSLFLPITLSKLYFISDTHLEHLDRPISIHTSRPELDEAIALVGDIGWIHEESYWKFVHKCASMYRVVFIVLGNHECYFHDIHEIATLFSRTLHEHYLPNVYFLQNEHIEFQNCIVWGSTLWTRITMDAFQRLNDQSTILDKTSPTKKLRMGTLFEQHNRAIYHLNQTMEISIKKNKPLIVLTHHAPLLGMNGKYIKSITASGYATDLSNYFKPPIKAWICGHTHQNLMIYQNDIPCYANCYGYPGEFLDVPFSPELFISLK
jgi:Icc-related predicted phosphoesterase